jgi:hypothetical protein
VAYRQRKLDHFLITGLQDTQVPFSPEAEINVSVVQIGKRMTANVYQTNPFLAATVMTSG